MRVCGLVLQFLDGGNTCDLCERARMRDFCPSIAIS